MKTFKYFILLSIIVLTQFSCSSSYKSTDEIYDERDYKSAEKYYNESKYDSSYRKLTEMTGQLIGGKYGRYDTVNIYYKNAFKLGLKCEPKFKQLCIDKCLEALDENNYNLAEKYLYEIPLNDLFGNKSSNIILLDSIKYYIGFTLLNEDNYIQAFEYFSNIKDVKSYARLIVPQLIIIGNKAVENGDLKISTKAYNSVKSANEYFPEEISHLKNRIDSLQISEEKRIAEENDRVEKSKPQFEIDGLKIVVNNAEQWNNYNKISSPKQGFIYYVVNVTVFNVTSEIKYVNPFGFKLKDSDGYTYSYSPLFGVEPTLGDGNMRPGDKMRGYISFEVLKSAKNFSIIYSSW